MQQEILEGVKLHEQLNRVQEPPELDEWLRTGKLPQDKPQHKPRFTATNYHKVVT